MVRTRGRGAAQPEPSRSKSKRGKAPAKPQVRESDYDKRSKAIEKKRIWPERGIELEELDSTFVPQVIQLWGWERVAAQHLPYNEAVVREFYTNLVPGDFAEHGTVEVQGVHVHITPQRINDFYQIQGVQQDNGLPLNEQMTTPALVAALRRDGTELWEAKTNPLFHGDIHLEAAFWNMFGSFSVNPTRHYQTISKRRMATVFVMHQRLRIDLGKIICQEIRNASIIAGDASHILPFPGLISHFCQDAGIDVFTDPDRVEPGTPPVDAETWNRLIKNHPTEVKLPTRNRRMVLEERAARAQAQIDALARGVNANFEQPEQEEPAVQVDEDVPQAAPPPMNEPSFEPPPSSFFGASTSVEAGPSSQPQESQIIPEWAKVLMENQMQLNEQLATVKSTLVALQSQVQQNHESIYDQLQQILVGSVEIQARSRERQEQEEREQQEQAEHDRGNGQNPPQ